MSDKSDTPTVFMSPLVDNADKGVHTGDRNLYNKVFYRIFVDLNAVLSDKTSSVHCAHHFVRVQLSICPLCTSKRSYYLFKRAYT